MVREPMANHKTQPKLVRTSVLVAEETDRALRALADAADRPLSREIRRALEMYVSVEVTKHPEVESVEQEAEL